MKIAFREKLVPKLKEKNLTEFTLETVMQSGWGGPRRQPVVDKGAPKNLDNYVKIEEDGFTFYVIKDLAEELDGYEVELSSIGMIMPRYFISSIRELN